MQAIQCTFWWSQPHSPQAPSRSTSAKSSHRPRLAAPTSLFFYHRASHGWIPTPSLTFSRTQRTTAWDAEKKKKENPQRKKKEILSRRRGAPFPTSLAALSVLLYDVCATAYVRNCSLGRLLPLMRSDSFLNGQIIKVQTMDNCINMKGCLDSTYTHTQT